MLTRVGPWLRTLLLSGALLVWGAGLGRTQPQANSGRNSAHDFGCITCHSVHKPKGPSLFPNPIPTTTPKGTPILGSDGLCFSCHRTEERGGKFFEPGFSHPVHVPVPKGMVVPRELGTTLVSGVGEVITCSSCHDPHNAKPGFLKRPLENDRLCIACHKMP